MAKDQLKTPKRLKGFGRVVRVQRELAGKLEAKFYWWRNQAIEGFWLLLLLFLNVYQAYPLWGREIDGSFSAPLIPFLAQLISSVAGFPIERSVTTTIFIFYLLGPLALYFWVKKVTERFLPGITAALIFGLPLFKARLISVFSYGDGAHIASLALIPLAAYFVFGFLRSGSFLSCVLASLAIVLVALTSPLGLFVSLIFLAIITFSEMLLSRGRLKLLRLLTVLFLTGGLSAFWYNPDFIRFSFLSEHGKAVLDIIYNLFPISFFLVPILGTFSFLLFVRKPFLQPLFIALALTVVFYLFSLAGRLTSSFFVSYRDRYLPEVALSFSFLLGVIITSVFDFLRTAEKISLFKLKIANPKNRLATLFLILLFLSLGIIFFRERPSWESLALLADQRVLGVASNNYQMTGFGGIRGETGLSARVLGHLITGFTAVIMAYLVVKNRHLSRKVKAEPNHLTGRGS